MGIWSHVECVIKVDSREAIDDFTKYFGKEIGTDNISYSSYENKDQYFADFEKLIEKHKKEWEAYKEHPEEYLPIGSEGSLHLKSRLQTRVKNTLYPYRYKVEIYGGLRDHYDGEAVIDHIKAGIKKLYKNGHCCIKATIDVINDLNGLYQYNFEDTLFRKKDFYNDLSLL